MNQFEFISGLQQLRAHPKGCVLTIGSFDGVHLGHMALIRALIERGKALNLPATAMIFEPQPYEYFLRDQAPPRLTRLREKVSGLRAAGIERVVCLRFNAGFRQLTANDYIQQILVDSLGVRHLIVGDDFRFGKERAGDFSLLQSAGKHHNFEVWDTPSVLLDGERISSTQIRHCLSENDLSGAGKRLGRPFTISGRVIYGNQLGTQLGFPTANIGLGRYQSPLRGVYAIMAKLQQRWIPGVANIGVRPTIGGRKKPILEVHLFDDVGSVYGAFLTVEFKQRLRDEMQFSSLEALKAQISHDKQQAKDWFHEHAVQ